MTLLNRPITRKTNSALTSMFGPYRDKRIVITLIPGNGDDVPDLISLRPERTQRAEQVAAIDVYMWAMKCRINAATMERLRERKAKLAIQRADRALTRAAKKAQREG